jgi:TonB family protein
MATTGTHAETQPRHYAWWFPGSPVRVHVDLRVIEGLQKQLRDTGHDADEHGLLFGRVQEGATEILEFRPAFNRSVPEMIVELSPEPGKRLVGYYRTGEILRLNEEDLSLFKTFFGKPYHVFLMMQPNGFGPANATFFFSQGNQRVSEFPFLEFPLDASLLATEERDRLSRCRQATELPAVAPEPLPPGSVKPHKQSHIFPRVAAGVVAVAVLLLPALWFTNAPFRERSTRAWNAIWSVPRQPPQPSPVSTSPPQPVVGLQVRRQAEDLKLTWDHDSPAVTAATSGFISIEDGTLKRKISLDARQLRGESVLYAPVYDQVLIQLTVTGPTGDATESVRVIRGQEIPKYSSPVPAPQLPDTRVPIAQASRPFTAPPVVKSAPAPPSLSEPPVLSGGQEHPAYALSAPVAPPRPLPASTPAPALSATASVPAYYPPAPVRKVTPTYPPELKGVSSKPTVVSIRVVIDKTGKVIKVEPLPQQNVHQLFVREALHAAELWRFQPARRGDEPVASESVLRFSFNQ